MSDLRTRISVALFNALNDPKQEWKGHLDVDLLAGAVIRELGLEAEDGECNYCHATLPGCRYSTWKADDE
jgi:hypothetical protein